MINKLNINKLIIEGEEYKRTLRFTAGLNIIAGDMYSGKSLVLNLIDYLLGRDEKFRENVQAELKRYCDKALLEVVLNGQILTIERNLWKEANFILVYFCNSEEIDNYSPRILTLKEYYEFLFEKMKIQQYKLLKYKTHSKERTLESLSFRDLMRFIYIDQHSLGTKYFMKLNDNILKGKHKFIFEVLFEFIEYDEKNILNDIKNIINEIENIKRQIEGLTSYTQEMKLGSKIELENLYSEYDEKIKQANNQKEEVVKNAQNNKSKMDTIYSRTKDKYIEVSNKLYSLMEKQKDLFLTAASKQKLMQGYNKEMGELAATKEAFELLSKKSHKYNCPICSTELTYNPTTRVKSQSVDELIYQLRSKINMVEDSISSTLNKIETLKKEAEYLEEQKIILERALDVFKGRIAAPYIPEIESINRMLREFQQNKDKINESIKILNKIQEKRNSITELEEKQKEFEEKQKELRISDEEKRNIIENLSRIYRSILKDLNLDAEFLHTNISPNNYQPVFKNATVTEHDSGGILACMQIAYLAAILLQKNNDETLKHPGFLMLDTVGKYLGKNLEARGEEYTEDMIMDPLTYKQLYNLIITLSEDNQIFVVDNIPHPISTDFIRYTFHNHGLRGLIDSSKNEKQQPM